MTRRHATGLLSHRRADLAIEFALSAKGMGFQVAGCGDVLAEVVEGVGATCQHRGIVGVLQLAHVRRDVLRVEADAAILAEIGSRSMQCPAVMERSLARRSVQATASDSSTPSTVCPWYSTLDESSVGWCPRRPGRWLPGTIRMQPLVSFAGDSASHIDTWSSPSRPQ